MGFREDTETLNRMPIQFVGNLLGLQLPFRGSAHCPFPDHADKSPSFVIGNLVNRWICYGCGRKGGAIDLVKFYHRINFSEAKRWLAARVEMDTTTLPPTSYGSRVMPIAKPSSPVTHELAESPPDYEVYEKLLQRAPLQKSGLKYLVKRGLSEEKISDFRIGQISNRRAILNTLIRTFGYQRLETAGLLANKSTTKNSLFIFPENSLLFPFIENGQITYFQSRLLPGTENRGKWRNLNHRKRRIYNIGALLDTRCRLFAICEGVIDTLSAIELGYGAIGLIGANAKLNKEQLSQLRGKQVVILLDWDSSGETGAADLQKEMRKFGIASTRKRCPSPTVKDVNEYLMERRAQS